VPLRLDVSALAATLNAAVPEPVPLVPVVTVIHPASARADHVQPAAVAIETVPEPPLGPKDEADSDRV
jgi:hypothetical protein